MESQYYPISSLGVAKGIIDCFSIESLDRENFDSKSPKKECLISMTLAERVDYLKYLILQQYHAKKKIESEYNGGYTYSLGYTVKADANIKAIQAKIDELCQRIKEDELKKLFNVKQAYECTPQEAINHPAFFKEYFNGNLTHEQIQKDTDSLLQAAQKMYPKESIYLLRPSTNPDPNQPSVTLKWIQDSKIVCTKLYFDGQWYLFDNKNNKVNFPSLKDCIATLFSQKRVERPLDDMLKSQINLQQLKV